LVNSKKKDFFQKHKEENKLDNLSVLEKYPKFSFEFNLAVEKKWQIENLSDKEKKSLLNKLLYLSKLTWKDINGLTKKGGFEKIPKQQFKKLSNIPFTFKDDKKISVFRFPSGEGRIIGYIENEVFYIVWVDTNFEMYKH